MIRQNKLLTRERKFTTVSKKCTLNNCSDLKISGLTDFRPLSCNLNPESDPDRSQILKIVSVPELLLYPHFLLALRSFLASFTRLFVGFWLTVVPVSLLASSWFSMVWLHAQISGYILDFVVSFNSIGCDSFQWMLVVLATLVMILSMPIFRISCWRTQGPPEPDARCAVMVLDYLGATSRSMF